MLISLEEIIGYALQGVDGKLGDVEDFYFDDEGWTVRYLLADTGGWLPGRRVLISPEEVGRPEHEAGVLPVEPPTTPPSTPTASWTSRTTSPW